MRGNDTMSASNKKQLRKEQYAEQMTERQKQAKSEAKKTKIATVSFIIVLALIVAVFVGSLVMNVINNSGIIEKNTVAATVGSHKLNSVMMNYFYIDAIESEYNYANQMAQAYSMDVKNLLGYDPSLPLSQQTNTQANKTWAAYYWDSALNNAKTIYAMYDKAVQDKYVLSQDYLSSIDQDVSMMQMYAGMYRTDVDGWISSIYGKGANEKNYREYQVIKITASAYYQDHQANKTFTADERNAYLNEHPNDYTAYSYNHYTVNYKSFLPELEEGATATEEQNNTAREEAKKAAETLAAATSIEELNTAISALSYNEGKTVASSVSTDVMHTSSTLTDEQKEWISAADRKQGDAKAFEVKTSTKNEDGTTTETVDSYKVLMYVSTNDFSQPLANVRHLLVAFEHNHTEGDNHQTDANGNTVYTDAEKAAAKAKAEELMNGWDKTEASFIELIKTNTDDTASAETGGLYEDIDVNANYETGFLNWAVDPARKANDYGIVETSYGYHIMFYVGNSETTNREYMIDQDLLSEHMTAWEKEIVDVVTVTPGNTKKINFDLIVSQVMG